MKPTLPTLFPMHKPQLVQSSTTKRFHALLDQLKTDVVNEDSNDNCVPCPGGYDPAPPHSPKPISADIRRSLMGEGQNPACAPKPVKRVHVSKDFSSFSRKSSTSSNSSSFSADAATRAARTVIDHISVVFYYGNEEVSEVFLKQGDRGFTFFETPSPGPLEPWRVPLENYLKSLKIPDSSTQGILRLDRWAVPGSDRMFSHVACAVRLFDEHKEQITDDLGRTSSNGGSWFTISEMELYHRERKLQSPDVMEIVHRLQQQQLLTNTIGTELTFEESYLGLDTTKDKKSGLELLVQAAKLGREEQETIYNEFLALSMPFLTLGFKAFARFMKGIGWSDSNCWELFRTFDMNNRQGLCYKDFLCGIAATEPIIQHGGPPAEIRCRYIFKFYDKDHDNRLKFNEFKNMVKDIRHSRKFPDDPHALNADAEKQAKLFGDTCGESLGLTEFLTTVGQLRFRGTSHLLRSPMSVIKYLTIRKEKNAARSSKSGKSGSMASSSTDDAFFGTCPPKPGVPPQPPQPQLSSIEECTGEGFSQSELQDSDVYEIANHSVRVKKSGTVLDVHPIGEIEHSGIFDQNMCPAGRSEALNRLNSIFNFSHIEQVKEMQNGLKYFERSANTNAFTGTCPIPDPNNPQKEKGPLNWGSVDKGALGSCLITICGLVKEILINEPRLLELVSPVYILGDLHGNFSDLICFENALWKLGPALTPASFLFLGDYVDRGVYGVEVISYLFSQKLTAPSKFNLLRGNHEIRDVQEMFTFQKECFTKFGPKLGKDVWNAVNDVFDVMPLAAVIDKKVFCAHGGIPPPWISKGSLDGIKSIPTPLSKPEEQSKLAWELMWSDPIDTTTLTTEQVAQLKMMEGFGLNLRRGTAHVFTEEALEAFLKRNGLSHVVRAHEVQQAGFQVQLGGKLLTVFSSSKYCGGSNEAACILADKLKLRTFRVNTS